MKGFSQGGIIPKQEHIQKSGVVVPGKAKAWLGGKKLTDEEYKALFKRLPNNECIIDADVAKRLKRKIELE